MAAFRTVVVCGAGVMGHSLALLHASKAQRVWLVDTSRDMLGSALVRIRDGAETLALFGALKEPVADLLARIEPTTRLADCLPQADLLVEAISENADLKRTFLAGLVTPPAGGTAIGPKTLVASNTSSLDVFQLAPEALLPQLYAAHHFVPPHIIPLAEIVQPAQPRAGDTERLLAHYRAVGAVPVLLKAFCPGFVINRLQLALHKELFDLLAKEVIDARQLDLAVKASLGVRIPVLGVVKRLDFAGLALVRGNMTRLDPDFVPPACLTELVAKGNVGIQAGRGFYEYAGRSVEDVCRERDEKMLQVRRLLEELGEFEEPAAGGCDDVS